MQFKVLYKNQKIRWLEVKMMEVHNMSAVFKVQWSIRIKKGTISFIKYSALNQAVYVLLYKQNQKTNRIKTDLHFLLHTDVYGCHTKNALNSRNIRIYSVVLDPG